MKKLLGLYLALGYGAAVMGQSDFNQIFASGVADAEQFADAYFAPISEGAIYSMANGWYNSADAKPLGGFEIAIVGNISGFRNKDDSQNFVLDTADYENLQFVDGSAARPVSTALGDIEGVRVFVEAEITPGVTERQEFELPTGLASEGLNFIPSAFVQASVGLVKGLEVKARFLPNINIDDNVEFGLLGGGLQYDFTKILPADKILPVALSAVIGYTQLDAEYNLEDQAAFTGANQRIETNFSTWTFAAIASTKLPVINFYGGVGYVTGRSETDLLGDYTIGVGALSSTVTDPFSIDHNTSGVTANVGTKLKLGFFRINVDYTLAAFNTLSAAINFGFR